MPEPDRLIKSGRHADRVALIACGRALPNWEQQHSAKLNGVVNLTIIRFDQAFISRLAATLDRSINWDMTISDGTLYLNAGAETFETALQGWTGNQ